MAIIMRPPSGANDLQRIYDLVQAFPAENFHVVDLPYRLCSPSAQDARNVQLWEDEQGNLLGFAIAQTPWLTLDYAVHPAAREPGLEERLLAWGLERWPHLMAERGWRYSLFVEVREDQAERIALLERLGFVLDDWHTLHLSQPLAGSFPTPAVPEGFSIRPLAGEAEAEACAALHRAAFGTQNMTNGWRRRTLEMPQYVPELDLVVVDPAGALAGFCLCWLSQRGYDANGSAAGQIEPMGVRPDLQQRGLGRALLLEGLRRLQARGATTAYVDSDGENDASHALYESVGFRIAYKVLKYRKDL
jgi:mycothiol synthase